MLVKELVLIDMFANIPVSALSMRPIPHLRADTAMYDLLKLFQTGRTHMVLLTRPPPGAKLLAAQAVGAAASRADLAVSIEPDTIRRAAEEVLGLLCTASEHRPDYSTAASLEQSLRCNTSCVLFVDLGYSTYFPRATSMCKLSACLQDSEVYPLAMSTALHAFVVLADVWAACVG